MTLDPLGFGEGYDKGNYGTNERLSPSRVKQALNSRSSSASIGSVSSPPPEYEEPVAVMAAQPAAYIYSIYRQKGGF
jgi:hypothetical protein